MRLSTTQMVLGGLIIIVSFYATGWMIHQDPYQSESKIPNITTIHELELSNVVLENEVFFNIGKYSSVFLPIFGILILITSTIEFVRVNARNWKCATLNIVSGSLIAVLAVAIIIWGYPTFSYSATIKGTDQITKMLLFSDTPSHAVIWATVSIFLFGLAVAGVGTTQLIKSRNIQNIPH